MSWFLPKIFYFFKDKKNRFEIIFWFGVLSVLSILFFRLSMNDPVLTYDDQMLVDPLKDVHSVSNYVAAVRLGKIFDIQPVRDLSLWLDFNAKKVFSWGSFHLTNVVIWFGIVLLVFRILTKLRVSRQLKYGAIAIYSVHPVFLNSVAWISARKHLLSAFFTISATYLVLMATTGKDKRKNSSQNLNWLGIIILYFLACFSHPINILWPAYAVVYLEGHGIPIFSSWRGKLLIFFCAAIGLSCFLLNENYYTGLYLLQTGGVEKYVPSLHNQFGVRLLAFGRYFIQGIFPAWPCSTNAYPGSPRNLAGLALFPVFVLALKKWGGKESWFWLFYFVVPLIPVLFKLTNIFVLDTYLLNAGLGLFIALTILVQNTQNHFQAIPRMVKITLLALCLIFFVNKSSHLAQAWRSDLTLWESSYQTEATPSNATKYGLKLLEMGQVTAALELAMRVKAWKADQVELPLLFSKAVYLHPSWSAEQKITILEADRMSSPWFSYFLASLYASRDHFNRAYSEIQVSLNPLDLFVDRISASLEVVTAETYYFCVKSHSKECASWVVRIKGYLQDHPYARVTSWDESKFSNRLRELDIKL